MKNRCPWADGDPLYEAYHDREWGVPVYAGPALFANLVLDGFQAGLSWHTILRKRPAFYEAFSGFDPTKIARYGPRQIERLMADAGIVRNRAKINATIANAKAYLKLEHEPGGFSGFVWSFVGSKPLPHKFTEISQVPAQIEEAQALSQALKQRGFSFVGPTIVYAFMQACGLVNDHLVSCPRYREVKRLVR